MLTSEEAGQILDTAEQIYSAAGCIRNRTANGCRYHWYIIRAIPTVLSVMGGAVVFTGQLLPLLKFPLSFDYLHVSRYNDKTKGGKVDWKVVPHTSVKDRVVLVLDDILDEGITLASIRERIMESGAKAFYSAVFANKDIGKSKPIKANFVGVTLPDRYVFGFGMDIYGSWRNLPAIYAVKE